jgi:hypothetical protein
VGGKGVADGGQAVHGDRTPFPQEVVSETSPGEIVAQIAAIDEAEERFATARAG